MKLCRLRIQVPHPLVPESKPERTPLFDNPRLERLSALSIQGVVHNVFTKTGPALMECGIENLRFISADNYQDIPGILEQL